MTKAFQRRGARFRGPLQGHVRVRGRRPRNRVWVTLARDRGSADQAAVPRRTAGGRLRFASTVRALLQAGDVDTELDRGRATPLHELSFGGSRATHDLYRGVRGLPPATVRVIRPDGSHTDTVYWTPAFERDPARASGEAIATGRTRWDGVSAHRGDAAHGRRRAGGHPVVRRYRLESIVVALLAEQAQRGLATFSIGFDSVGGEPGDEYFYSTW